MRRIEIDDHVFAHLQSVAVPYVETPNDTLRRVLRVDGPENGEPTVSEPERIYATITRAAARKRAKASLGALISAGLLKNGQQLFLHDYQGNRIPGGEATVGGYGIWPSDKRRLYSMSDLAQELLEKEGYQSESVRGPSHWFTEEGRSITNLWEQYLAGQV